MVSHMSKNILIKCVFTRLYLVTKIIGNGEYRNGRLYLRIKNVNSKY